MTEIQLKVTPEELLVDEEFQVSVTGLDPHQKVTIHSQITEGKDSFSGVGCYVADDNGHVLCNKHASVAGTFTGVHPMGLVWSIVQSPGQKPGRRLFKNDVTVPQVINIFVHSGHYSLENLFSKTLPLIASKKVKRWYMAENVKRVPIQTGRIYGTLFVPAGPGPFPAVIDLFGSTGGLLEYRASMLASRGIMALALAYFLYEDLPDTLFQIDITYFKEAIYFLANHPKCSPGGIGIVGVSKGGEIVQIVSMCCPLVKAVVVINGCPFVSYTQYVDGDTVYKDDTTGCSFDVRLPEKATDEFYFRDYCPIDITHVFQVHKSKAKFLYIGGTDDQNIPVELQLLPYLKCPKDQQHRINIVTYPGAGHLIEVPYSPLTRATFTKMFGCMTVWGGKALEHNMAQVDSWQRIQMFFKNNLLTKTTDKLLPKCKL